MIKLTDRIYVHWLTLLLFSFAYITRTLGFMSLMYSVMLLHETAHAIAAKILHLGISRIIFYPFGLCLQVRTRILCSFSDEIILYASGPLVNGLIAAFMCVLNIKNIFFYNNLALFFLNLLPIRQLDGGRIYTSIIEHYFGQRKADLCMRVISTVISASLALLLLYFKALNPNTVPFIAFICGNIISQKRKYNRDFIRELALREKKRKKSRSNVYLSEEDLSRAKLISEFSPVRRNIVFFSDKNGIIYNVKTDTEIFAEILR